MRVVAALKRLGAPVGQDGINGRNIRRKQVVYQIGVAPVRVNILTEITAVEFSTRGKRR